MNLLVVNTHLFSFAPAKLLHIQEMAPGLTLQVTSAPTQAMVSDSEIICGCPPKQLLAEAPDLKWLHLTNAGIEPYGDLGLYANRDILLTNASGVYGASIAEHAVGLMVGVSRFFERHVLNKQSRRWQRIPEARDLYGSTVVIMGLGDLGSQLAKRLSSFGCRILGVRRSGFDKPPHVEAVYPPHALLTVAREADYLVNCLPQTAETVGLLDHRVFEAMPTGSVLINVGRGSAVVESALVDAIRSGHLYGAGLDVADPEPLPPESPLWDLDNVLITSHSSSASSLQEQRSYELFTDLLDRYLSKRRLYNIVDFFRGY